MRNVLFKLLKLLLVPILRGTANVLGKLGDFFDRLADTRDLNVEISSLLAKEGASEYLDRHPDLRIKLYGWDSVQEDPAKHLALLNAKLVISRIHWHLSRYHGHLALQALGTLYRSAFSQKSRSEICNPPRLAKFVLLLVPKKNREHLLGDLDEEFRTILVPEYGPRKARLWYWWHVTISIMPLVWDQLKRIATATVFWKLTR